MKNIFLLVFFYFLLISCSKPSEVLEKDIVHESQPISDLRIDFVRTFEGKIDDKHDIVLKIKSIGGQIDGAYFYRKIATDIDLKGSIDNSGIFLLGEFDKNGNQTGVFNGRMLNENRIEGNWSKPNGEKAMSFTLIETNSDYEILKKKINEVKHESLTGIYTFDYTNSSGTVKVEYLGSEKIKFGITVGSQNCTGDVHGVAVLKKDGLWRHASSGCESLVLSFNGKKLSVKEYNCDLHGMSCEFTGEYFKISNTAKIKTPTILDDSFDSLMEDTTTIIVE